MTSNSQIAIIVPCYNEAEALPEFIRQTAAVCKTVAADFRLIVIDDGSIDGTYEALQHLAGQQHDITLQAIRLSRNFGKENAISCGLQHSDADAVIVMDADLQDPPGQIPAMINHWLEGYDSVIAVRDSRDSDSAIKRMTAAAFYSLMRRIADVEIPRQAGDFRLLSRRLVLALNHYPERSRFMKGLFASLGFKQKLLYFSRSERTKGKSSFSLWRLWNFALDGIASFSSLPLRIWSYFGFLMALFGLLYAGWIFIRTVIFGVDLPGYASILVSILFFSGIQLISIGILGEYIGRIFTEVKRRPMYLVDDSYGFAEDKKPGILPPRP